VIEFNIGDKVTNRGFGATVFIVRGVHPNPGSRPYLSCRCEERDGLRQNFYADECTLCATKSPTGSLIAW
jgi:hypothetical protein